MNYLCRIQKYFVMGTVIEPTVKRESAEYIPVPIKNHPPVTDPNIRKGLEASGTIFDEEGRPLNLYTTEEVITGLDYKFIDRFGEEYRILTNRRRCKLGWRQL
jgi:hypothetical protein